MLNHMEKVHIRQSRSVIKITLRYAILLSILLLSWNSVNTYLAMLSMSTMDSNYGLLLVSLNRNFDLMNVSSCYGPFDCLRTMCDMAQSNKSVMFVAENYGSTTQNLICNENIKVAFERVTQTEDYDLYLISLGGSILLLFIEYSITLCAYNIRKSKLKYFLIFSRITLFIQYVNTILIVTDRAEYTKDYPPFTYTFFLIEKVILLMIYVCDTMYNINTAFGGCRPTINHPLIQLY